MTYNECHNCKAEVAVRKPTQSGASFCARSECQAAKQRFFRQRKKAGETGNSFSDVGQCVQAYVRDALHEPRVLCRQCGLENAVHGWLHRNARTPEVPCDGVGSGGRRILPVAWFDIVHPGNVPTS
jgi:hypothetical protein